MALFGTIEAARPQKTKMILMGTVIVSQLQFLIVMQVLVRTGCDEGHGQCGQSYLSFKVLQPCRHTSLQSPPEPPCSFL